MLDFSDTKSIDAKIDIIGKEEVVMLLSDNNDVKNCIGHADTAAVVQNDLGIALPPAERVFVVLNREDSYIIAQYVGGRLPEGTKVLPEGSQIKYFQISI